MKETLDQSMVPDQDPEKIEEQPIQEDLATNIESQQEELPDQLLLNVAFDKIYNFEPTTEEEKFNKAGIQESLEDISLLFENDEEGGIEDQTPCSTLIALRGVEEIQKNYPLSADLGLQELKDHYAAEIQRTEGFGVEEAEDLDAMLNESREDLQAGMNKMLGSKELSPEQLAAQLEKLEKYLMIKEEISSRQKQLIKNNSGFYGGYAEKIKKVFEGAGEKLDAKMTNSRLLKMIGEKKFSTSFSRMAAAGMVVSVGVLMLLNPAESEAAEDETGELYNELEVTDEIDQAENAEPDQEVLAKLQESQEKAKEFINDLGIFSKINLIIEIKKNAEDIKALLKEGSENINNIASKNLSNVLKIYIMSLDKIKDNHPEIYQQEVEKICKFIDTIKTSSLSELKNKFA